MPIPVKELIVIPFILNAAIPVKAVIAYFIFLFLDNLLIL